MFAQPPRDLGCQRRGFVSGMWRRSRGGQCSVLSRCARRSLRRREASMRARSTASCRPRPVRVQASTHVAVRRSCRFDPPLAALDRMLAAHGWHERRGAPAARKAQRAGCRFAPCVPAARYFPGPCSLRVDAQRAHSSQPSTQAAPPAPPIAPCTNARRSCTMAPLVAGVSRMPVPTHGAPRALFASLSSSS